MLSLALHLAPFLTYNIITNNNFFQSPLEQPDHWKIFSKYATPPASAPTPATAPAPTPVLPPSAGGPPSTITPVAAAASLPTPAPTPTLTKTPSSALPDNAREYSLSIDGFAAFLLSTENAAFADNPNVIQDGNNAKKEPWMDMNRPLSEYYISTSHNTYLVGHQLVGVSTIEGYIRALLGGCRSVERTYLKSILKFWFVAHAIAFHS